MSPPATRYDAHLHLQDPRLAGCLEEAFAYYEAGGAGRVVCNGVGEADWPDVEVLSRTHPVVLPSYGLHPWQVGKQSPQWRDDLRRRWDQGGCGAGEIGLDRWIEGYDLPAQEDAFCWQFAEAAARDLPISIHCLRAWGELHRLLRELPRPRRGFLLHSYGGSAELGRQLARLGARFSIAGHFGRPRKRRQREVFASLPEGRLLVETDAPDMLGPPELVERPARDAAGQPVNHPANLEAVYRFAAELRQRPLEDFAASVERTFKALFGPA